MYKLPNRFSYRVCRAFNTIVHYAIIGLKKEKRDDIRCASHTCYT